MSSKSVGHDAFPEYWWTLKIPMSFRNTNQGYNSEISLDCSLIDGNGYWRVGRVDLSAGPGMMGENDLTMTVGCTDEEAYTLTSCEAFENTWKHEFPNTNLSSTRLACSGEGSDFVLALPTLP